MAKDESNREPKSMNASMDRLRAAYKENKKLNIGEKEIYITDIGYSVTAEKDADNAIEEFKKAHNGRMPTADEIGKLAENVEQQNAQIKRETRLPTFREPGEHQPSDPSILPHHSEPGEPHQGTSGIFDHIREALENGVQSPSATVDEAKIKLGRAFLKHLENDPLYNDYSPEELAAKTKEWVDHKIAKLGGDKASIADIDKATREVKAADNKPETERPLLEPLPARIEPFIPDHKPKFGEGLLELYHVPETFNPHPDVLAGMRKGDIADPGTPPSEASNIITNLVGKVIDSLSK